MAYQLTYRWARRPEPHAVDEEYLRDLPLLRATLIRFTHVFSGEFRVPLQGGTLTFLLEDDFTIVFDQLPSWLSTIAAGEGKAELLFGSQGTELALIAESNGDMVRISAQSLDPEQPLSMRPLDIRVNEFLREWSGFILDVLDALAKFDSALLQNEEWQQYRASVLRAARPRQE
jgi:hypothetical protein